MKDDVMKLRDTFKKLRGKETISGCKTWESFCETKLHRGIRAVQHLLRGERPQPKANNVRTQFKDPNSRFGGAAAWEASHGRTYRNGIGRW